MKDLLARVRRIGDDHLIKGTVHLIAGTGITSILGYLYWTYLARRWAVDDVGAATTLGAGAAVVSMLAGQPLATTLMARLPRTEPARQRDTMITAAGGALLMGTVLGLITGTLITLTTDLTLLTNPLNMLLFVITAATQAAGTSLDGCAMSVRKSRLVGARNALSSAGRLLLLLLVGSVAATVGGGQAALLAASTVSTLTVIWIGVLTIGRGPRPTRNSTRDAAKTLLRSGGSQTVGSLAASVPAQTIPILVAAVAGVSASGKFGISWLIGSTCFMIAPLICTALLVEGAHDPEKVRRRATTALQLTAMLVGPLGIVLLLFGGRILELFGPGYAAASTVLTLLVVSAAPNAYLNTSISILRVQERLRAAAAVTVTSGTIAVLGTLLLARSMGAVGGGWAWLLGQILGAILGAALLGRPRETMIAQPGTPGTVGDLRQNQRKGRRP